MTRPARITQADMIRATMAAAEAHKRHGLVVRVIFHLHSGQIETVIGNQAPSAGDHAFAETYSADDV